MRKGYLLLILASSLIFGGAGCISFSGGSSGAVGPVGFFISSDKGDNWKSISLIPTAAGVQSLAGVSVYGLIEDPQDSNGLYWLTRGTGMYYSYDGGAGWKITAPPLSSGFIYGLAIHPENKCALFATNGRQIFKSDDCNRSWLEMYREADNTDQLNSVAINPFSPFEIYITKAGGDMLRSEDSGQSWQLAHRFNANVVKIVFDTLEKDLVYAITRDNGFLRSKDGGKTWVDLGANLSAYTGALEYRRFYLNPRKAGQIYWISKFGILMSRNFGADWEAINLITPPGSVSIYSFAVNPLNEREIYYTATVNNLSTFYRSMDGGKNWVTRKLPSDQLPITLRVNPDNTNLLYLGFTTMPKN